MSFRTASQRFAAQVSTHLAETFGGAQVDGTADANGYNLQIGERKFNAAFSRLQSAVELRQFGRSLQCTAKIALPRSLAIPVSDGTVVIHIVTGERYVVTQIGVEASILADIPILLRREEP